MGKRARHTARGGNVSQRSLQKSKVLCAAIVLCLTAWLWLGGFFFSATISSKFSMKKLRTRFHDKGCFTQGLVYRKGELVESCGLYGESDIRRVDPVSGEVKQKIPLEKNEFAEGIVYLEDTDEILQMTWKERVGYLWGFSDNGEIYLKEKIPALPTTTQKEHWGICHNTTHFFVTDGSAYIHVWSRYPRITPVTRIQVKSPSNKPIPRLNELEYIPHPTHPYILANIWYNTSILRIHPQTGLGIDSHSLEGTYRMQTGHDVLNGIAYDSEAGTCYITGKQWSKLFEFEISI